MAKRNIVRDEGNKSGINRLGLRTRERLSSVADLLGERLEKYERDHSRQRKNLRDTEVSVLKGLSKTLCTEPHSPEQDGRLPGRHWIFGTVPAQSAQTWSHHNIFKESTQPDGDDNKENKCKNTSSNAHLAMVVQMIKLIRDFSPECVGQCSEPDSLGEGLGMLAVSLGRLLAKLSPQPTDSDLAKVVEQQANLLEKYKDLLQSKERRESDLPTKPAIPVNISLADSDPWRSRLMQDVKNLTVEVKKLRGKVGELEYNDNYDRIKPSRAYSVQAESNRSGIPNKFGQKHPSPGSVAPLSSASRKSEAGNVYGNNKGGATVRGFKPKENEGPMSEICEELLITFKGGKGGMSGLDGHNPLDDSRDM